MERLGLKVRPGFWKRSCKQRSLIGEVSHRRGLSFGLEIRTLRLKSLVIGVETGLRFLRVTFDIVWLILGRYEALVSYFVG